MADEHKDEHGHSGGGGDSHGGGSHGGGGHGGGHGGGGHAEGEHEGAPEWLISFADNVMLQMGFFVILLALNMGPKGGGAQSDSENAAQGGQTDQMLDFVISLREGFNNPVNMSSARPEDAALIRRMMQRKQGHSDSEGPRGENDRQQAPRPSDFDRVTAAIPFDDRSALIAEQDRDVIRQVADAQKGQRWILEVRGHASPFESMRNPQRAVELSYQRALAVAQALVDAGMTWPAIRVVACGDTDRVVPRTFDRDQDRGNQRVEIVVTNYPVPADPYATPTPEN